jgi:hypothetical protein
MAVFQGQKTGDIWKVDGTINTGTRMTRMNRLTLILFLQYETRRNY